MKKLWAPWRKSYIKSHTRKPSKGCLFCRLKRTRKDASHYLVKRTPLSFAVLNIYPYNNGHVLIVPNRHVASVAELSDEEQLDWLRLYRDVQEALEHSMNAGGFNVGMNVGSDAGAGIPEHLHLHVVPRWKGDTNFMPVLAGTKVISESLESVYRTLKKAMS